MTFDQAQGGIAFVWGEVIHDDQVAASQSGTKHFAHVGAKDFGIGGSRDGHARRGAIQAD